MKKILAALLFVVSAFSHAQIVTVPIPGAPGLSVTVGTGVNALPLRDIRTNPGAVNITTSDDWYNEVPLGFTFPLFGQNFTTSWAATNGYVTFQNPQTSGLWGGCCSGINLANTTDPRYNYTIFGMHTDLFSWNGQNQFYLREGNSMTYGWYNLSQCCSSQGGNSFEIKIDSTGLIDTRIAGAMVSWNAVTSGVSGNLSQGQYYQYYHGQGLNITPGSSNIFSWQALNGTGQGVDPCTVNPLSSPSCPGYAQAYHDQQCSINPLHAPSCPGYAQAFFNQQCTINSLYNTACPGYAAAYFQQQCTASALYSPSCPGYQQAFFNQQCTANPLYNSACPGYQQAYFNQQCTADPLYNSNCPGYEEAYRAAQFAQACSNNPQISPRCPNYVAPTTTTTPTSTTTASATTTEPVATTTTSTTTTTSSTPVTTSTPTLSTSEPVTTVSVSPTGTLTSPTAVAVVADPVVNNIVTNNQTTTAVTATSAVAQANAPSTSTTTTTTPTTTSSASSSSSSSSGSSGGSGSSSSNSQTQSTRAALVATLTKPGGASGMTGGSGAGSSAEPTKADVTATGAAAMKDADTATSMEQQKQVQNVVLGAMGYVPGFDAYNIALRDASFYRPFTIYGGQRNVDNAMAGRRLFGATDQLHNQMVQSQYNLGN